MSKKVVKRKAGDERPAAKDIKGAVEAAHELYIHLEHAIAEALHCGTNIKCEVQIPYHVAMQLPKGTFPDAMLVAKILILWDGSLNGVELDAKSGKIS